MREDTIDDSTFTANIKRKHPNPRRGGKAGRMTGGDEDDDFDFDDEDWTGGVRRVSNSGRKSYSGRGSRQRW